MPNPQKIKKHVNTHPILSNSYLTSRTPREIKILPKCAPGQILVNFPDMVFVDKPISQLYKSNPKFQKEQTLTKNFYCKFCVDKFKSEHMVKHNMQTFCNKCGTSSETERLQNTENHFHTCLQCKMIFSLESMLEKHNTSVHPSNAPDDKCNVIIGSENYENTSACSESDESVQVDSQNDGSVASQNNGSVQIGFQNDESVLVASQNNGSVQIGSQNIRRGLVASPNNLCVYMGSSVLIGPQNDLVIGFRGDENYKKRPQNDKNISINSQSDSTENKARQVVVNAGIVNIAKDDGDIKEIYLDESTGELSSIADADAVRNTIINKGDPEFGNLRLLENIKIDILDKSHKNELIINVDMVPSTDFDENYGNEDGKRRKTAAREKFTESAVAFMDNTESDVINFEQIIESNALSESVVADEQTTVLYFVVDVENKDNMVEISPERARQLLEGEVPKTEIKQSQGVKRVQVSSERVNTCAPCGRTFHSKYNLRRHLANKHGVHDAATLVRGTSSRHDATTRVRRQGYDHRKVLPEGSASSPTVKRRECDACNKIFATKSGFRYHYKRHHAGPSTHLCEVCSRMFCTAVALRNHHVGQHQQHRPHQCQRCDRTFVTKEHLRKHVHWQHEGRRDHLCVTCGLAFQQYGHLTSHQRIHAGVKPYACIECASDFASKCALKRHRKNVHDDGTQS